MGTALQFKFSKSLRFLIFAWSIAGLLGCGGMVGLGNRATDSGASDQPGGALDEFSEGQNPGDPSDVGPLGGGGAGPLGGSGGGMTGGGATGEGNTPGSDPNPFDNVDTNPANVPGSSSECSGDGGTGSCQQPGLFRVAYFNLSVSLHQDPDTQGGDCNSLWPEKKVIPCATMGGLQSIMQSPFNFLIGKAWALPIRPTPGEDAPICDEETIQPPIDPKKVPLMVVRSEHRLELAGTPGSYPIVINDQFLPPKCLPSGKWFRETGPIKHYMHSDASKNVITIFVDALYPQNGEWVNRGTKTVTLHCDDATGKLTCHEPLPINILTGPQVTPLKAQ